MVLVKILEEQEMTMEEQKKGSENNFKKYPVFPPKGEKRKMTRKRSNWKRRRKFRLPGVTEESKRKNSHWYQMELRR